MVITLNGEIGTFLQKQLSKLSKGFDNDRKANTHDFGLSLPFDRAPRTFLQVVTQLFIGFTSISSQRTLFNKFFHIEVISKPLGVLPYLQSEKALTQRSPNGYFPRVKIQPFRGVIIGKIPILHLWIDLRTLSKTLSQTGFIGSIQDPSRSIKTSRSVTDSFQINLGFWIYPILEWVNPNWSIILCLPIFNQVESLVLLLEGRE